MQDSTVQDNTNKWQEGIKYNQTKY